MTDPDLPGFLLARIAEVETDARPLLGRRWYVYDDGQVIEWDGETWADGSDYLPNRHQGVTLLYDPARVLAWCAAMRAIVEEHELVGSDLYPEEGPLWCATCVPRRTGPCPTLRFLALPFADHPDYRESWRV